VKFGWLPAFAVLAPFMLLDCCMVFDICPSDPPADDAGARRQEPPEAR
jgi:hypothetical protein